MYTKLRSGYLPRTGELSYRRVKMRNDNMHEGGSRKMVGEKRLTQKGSKPTRIRSTFFLLLQNREPSAKSKLAIRFSITCNEFSPHAIHRFAAKHLEQGMDLL
jgi:hypothetical protein